MLSLFFALLDLLDVIVDLFIGGAVLKNIFRAIGLIGLKLACYDDLGRGPVGLVVGSVTFFDHGFELIVILISKVFEIKAIGQ